MLKFIIALTLFISTPAMDAAPLISELTDLHQVSLNGGDPKLTDPWTSSPDIHETTVTSSIAKLLRTGPATTNSKWNGKTTGASHRSDKTTSPRNVVTKGLSRQLKIASETIDSNELKNIIPASIRVSRRHNLDPVINFPETKERTTTEGHDIYKRLQLTPVSTDSNKQSKTSSEMKRTRMSLSTSSPDRREKIMKMLSVLEELQKAVDSTLSSRITIIPRGINNGRNSGKKTKTLMTDGNHKSTTVPPVGSNSTSPRTSTDQADPKLLNGKAFKKSLPSTPKKTNKRGDKQLMEMDGDKRVNTLLIKI